MDKILKTAILEQNKRRLPFFVCVAAFQMGP